MQSLSARRAAPIALAALGIQALVLTPPVNDGAILYPIIVMLGPLATGRSPPCEAAPGPPWQRPGDSPPQSWSPSRPSVPPSAAARAAFAAHPRPADTASTAAEGHPARRLRVVDGSGAEQPAADKERASRVSCLRRLLRTTRSRPRRR